MFISFVALLGGSIISNTGTAGAERRIAFGDIPIAELRADALACIDKADCELNSTLPSPPARRLDLRGNGASSRLPRSRVAIPTELAYA